MDNIFYEMMVTFNMSATRDLKGSKYIYVGLAFTIYFLQIFLNLTIVMTVVFEKALHEPMYIFLCNLCINGLYGTAGFYPTFIYNLLSNSHVISYRGCFIQALVIYTSYMCEYTTLVIMAYDRYVAICRPLQYHTIMTAKTTAKSILYSWTLPFIAMSGAIVLASRLPLCSFNIDKLFCDNWSIVKLSCVPTVINNIYGFIVIFVFMAHAACIMFSYQRLINACRKSKEVKMKFMQTCLPHLFSLINFTIATLFDVMFSRFGAVNFPSNLRNVLQVQILVIPPIFNPIIYGLKLTEVRRRLFRKCKKLKVTDFDFAQRER